jgi:hypothetical protein
MATIYNHSTNPMSLLSLVGKPARNVFYGVELEVNMPDDSSSRVFTNAADTVIEYLTAKFAMLKRDGSIGRERGFEIVTAPAGLSIHRKKWEPLFENWPSGLGADARCGMHVHFSKAPFSREQLQAMHKFFTRDEHVKKIEVIAGRKKNHYTEFIQKETEEDFARFPRDKYEALNLLPRATAEVRIFASTVKFGVFMKNLEFVAALTGKTLVTGTPGSWGEFTSWVGRKSGVYPELVKFLHEKGL